MRRRRSIFLVAGLAAVFAPAALAPAAFADTRYADPAGSGTTCSQGSPCDLEEAVNNAGGADEVIVNPGSYSQASQALFVSNSTFVHGAAGQAVPQINFTSPGSAVQISLSGHISRLRIEVSTAGDALRMTGGTAEQIYARTAAGGGSVACALTDALIRDSVCTTPAASGEALFASAVGTAAAVTVRNVTAIATGTTSIGLDLFGSGGGQLSVSIKNSIFRGVDSDVSAFPGAVSDSISGSIDHSNYISQTSGGGGTDSVVYNGGGNQTSAPLFVNAAIGDFHQLLGSPTINAGTDDAQNGPGDIDGEARNQGTAPDIGADESDGTPPQTTIKKKPKRKTKSRTARFKFRSSEAGSTFSCKLDKGKYKKCKASSTYKHLKPGRHALSVRATDAFGNTDASPAKYRWKVGKPSRRHGHGHGGRGPITFA